MPRREDIRSILILGSGPIVIGQACEFDYSGAQACKALREEGYKVLLANSNPATIMTDPQFADRTYIEPLTPESLERILERERPDAILPTLGGQTALNLAAQLSDRGILERLGIRLLGATREVIHKAEDREAFKQAMQRIGLEVPRSALARSLEEAESAVREIGLPCVIRPAYTLGGIGGGIAYNIEEFRAIARRGLSLSMVGEILVEESVVGWKEFELEVMRDCRNNAVIVCSIENFDPMGIHTGDSITVAPAQTLTDKEYQRMRDAALAIMAEIGVETGGSNIQFAVEPATGRMTVIEMNPRVSRSSALASKATGFPIAKIAAKLAVGYTLDEIRNDITRETPASFEPTIDYCVVKVPRWAFEKFPSADRTLGTAMKSVGEVMAIGRSFPEALQKALRGLEIGRDGLGLGRQDSAPGAALRQPLAERLAWPHPERIFAIGEAMREGMAVEEIHRLTRVDPWFLAQMQRIVREESAIRQVGSLPSASPEVLRRAKRLGFSDAQLARAWNSDARAVRAARLRAGVAATFKRVDTCAAEFEAHTPYCYSTYESECEARRSESPTIVILGGGPNRIGQGIEFDYCCVHAAFALKELGYQTVMVNSNPETVSTDYDTSDQLYFEPLTVEDVLNVCDVLRPQGIIVQFGGQTPLNLAHGLEAGGQRILGTSVDSIDLASARDRFSLVVKELGLRQPANGIANNFEEALAVAEEIGYPVVVRPSYVLGGRAMEIVFDREELERYMRMAVEASPERPVLVDRFLEDATEVDVDAVSDGRSCVIGGIMEHVEEAGIHSGDSCCVLPPPTLPVPIVEEIRRATHALALRLGVKGLMNIQFAIQSDRVYLLEVNPRASRTVPFVSKATGVPLAKIAARVMAGLSLEEAGMPPEPWPAYYSVKEPVFPFARFPGCDVLLGPEMRSTGEVMGIDADLGRAMAKAKLGAGQALPRSGRIFVSVKDADKREAFSIARRLHEMGYTLVATGGTHRVLVANGVPAEYVHKLHEGRPNVLDMVKNRKVDLIINTPSGRDPKADEAVIRAHAVDYGIPLITNIHAAAAAVDGMAALRAGDLAPVALQDLYTPVALPAARAVAAR